MTFFIDTNVFLRFFLNDHKTHSPAANKLFQEAKKGKINLVTNSLIVAEIVFTLESYYSLTKKEIIEKIHAIMFFDGLEILEKNILLRAIMFYQEKNIDFTDAYAAAYALENKIGVCSFDHDFDKIKEVKRIDPISI